MIGKLEKVCNSILTNLGNGNGEEWRGLRFEINILWYCR